MDEVLYVVLESDQVEQRAAGIERDEEIYVAVRAIRTPGGRTKDADVGRAASCGEHKDLLTMSVKDRVLHLAVILPP
jgi:hypothetical protein